MRYSEITEMSVNTGGLEYEAAVRKAISQAVANLPNVSLVDAAPTGGFDSHTPDIVLNIDGTDVAFEVKQNAKAQMGERSLRYNANTGEITFTKDLDPDLEEITLEIFDGIIPHITNFFNFLNKNHPKSDNYQPGGYPTFDKFPVTTVHKDVWEAAKKQGLLRPLNFKIDRDASYVIQHYASKGVDYIQIGGLGLFYLDDNPLQLPIPQLESFAQVEGRAKRGGLGSARKAKDPTDPRRNATFPLVGRLQFNDASPYSLDDPNSIVKLFGQSK